MKKWYWYLLGFGVFAGLVIVLLVYGISTHEEPGFAEDWPLWERSDFPLDVHAMTHADGLPLTADDSDATDVDAAMRRLNARLGFEALRWGGIGDAHLDGRDEISITLQAPAEPGWLDPGGDAGMQDGVCFIRQANTAGAQDLTVLVLYHELGHCLGLAHDDYRQSIMYPEQRPTPDRQIPPWISDWDRELLRGRYAP